MFQSERFFREAWPTISQAASPSDAARDITWIAATTGVPPATRVLDAPCGFGRHSIELARRGHVVTGVDSSKTEIERAREAADRAGVKVTLVCQDIRDMEFAGEFDLAVNLFSSIGYFSDDEDRMVLDRFWRALRPGGVFALYSAHELAAMLRPDRWSHLDFYGALDGTPFSLDAPRLVIVVRK